MNTCTGAGADDHCDAAEEGDDDDMTMITSMMAMTRRQCITMMTADDVDEDHEHRDGDCDGDDRGFTKVLPRFHMDVYKVLCVIKFYEVFLVLSSFIRFY